MMAPAEYKYADFFLTISNFAEQKSATHFGFESQLSDQDCPSHMHLSVALLLFGLAAASPAKRQAKQPSMGFVGCSMSENAAQGYVTIRGKHMWGPYGNGGLVVQSWTKTKSASWAKFDQQTARYGKSTEVWVQIYIF